MKSDADLTWDERNAPYSIRFEDRYFSVNDGREETRAVFLDGNGLPDRWQDGHHFQIAELGFGTGLNFFETLRLWRENAPCNAKLTFTSFEQYPLTHDEMLRALSCWPDLADLAVSLCKQWPPQTAMDFGDVKLQLIMGDARQTLARWQRKADAWYLDGFSPAKNPQLWGSDLLQEVFDHSHWHGTFSTYTAAGFVRRNLQAAGFEVNRVQGFNGKRERLQGVKRQGSANQTVIRTAKPDDIEKIKAVLLETWHDSYDEVFGPQKVDQYCDHWHSIDILNKRLAKPNVVMLVAIRDESIVATASASMDRHNKMTMKQLYVKPDHQGSGIGGQLFDHLLAQMPTFSCIQLEVEPNNAGAIAFYQKRGFTITKWLDDCGGTGDLVKALIMTRAGS